jgi:peptide chain release factor subunit 1
MALPIVPTPEAVRSVVQRLAGFEPSATDRVVSCYLKLEPRDKARGKYLIKMKNRVKETATRLGRKPLGRDEREAIATDLGRVLRYFEEPGHLPPSRGVAVFACGARGLFEAIALPHVHRSRLAVEPTPLIRELVALDQEFGTILVVAGDRTGARFFEVTAFDVTELAGLAAVDVSRGSRFHGERQTVRTAGAGGRATGSPGEHNYHMRIREEKHRHYARVADQIFQRHAHGALTGIVVAGVGADAGALVPHLHTTLHDLVLGVVRLNPKKITPAEAREAALALREERERSWELAHAEAVRENVGMGWAVQGIEPTLKALRRGQVRILLADGQAEDSRIDEAIEEALRQRAQVDVVYDPKARRAVPDLAALLRFRR